MVDLKEKILNLGYKIPIIDRRKFKVEGSYFKIPVDSDDPHFHEPLIPLSSINVAYESYYAKTDGNNPPFCQRIEGSRPDTWLRKTVAEKLVRVNETLYPFGVELFVVDGYRPIRCQQGMYDFHYGQAKQELPNASEQEWRQYALGYAIDTAKFDPTDSTTWLPHTTGAAVDLVLQYLSSGALVDMGSNFEEITNVSNNDYFERQLLRGVIKEDDSRLLYRRLFNWAMTQEGFANITSFVYWHYDWGNQLYVLTRNGLSGDAPKMAWYGYIEPPPVSEDMA